VDLDPRSGDQGVGDRTSIRGHIGPTRIVCGFLRRHAYFVHQPPWATPSLIRLASIIALPVAEVVVAEQQFRRIIGYRDLATLVVTIERYSILASQ
jgi:hypothetical protein